MVLGISEGNDQRAKVIGGDVRDEATRQDLTRPLGLWKGLWTFS